MKTTSKISTDRPALKPPSGIRIHAGIKAGPVPGPEGVGGTGSGGGGGKP